MPVACPAVLPVSLLWPPSDVLALKLPADSREATGNLERKDLRKGLEDNSGKGSSTLDRACLSLAPKHKQAKTEQNSKTSFKSRLTEMVKMHIYLFDLFKICSLFKDSPGIFFPAKLLKSNSST